jgi:predicted PurR-regulated permease PerM
MSQNLSNNDTDTLNIFHKLAKQKGGNVPQPGQTFYIPNSLTSSFSSTSDENYSDNFLKPISNFVNKYKYFILFTLLLVIMLVIIFNYRNKIKNTFVNNNNRDQSNESLKTLSTSSKSLFLN